MSNNEICRGGFTQSSGHTRANAPLIASFLRILGKRLQLTGSLLVPFANRPMRASQTWLGR